MDMMSVPQPTGAFGGGPMDEADLLDDLPGETDLVVGPEGPRLGPGPGHPEVMAWARAM